MWEDVTLRELVGILQEVHPLTREHDVLLDLAQVHPHPNRGNEATFRPLGRVHAHKEGPADDKMLRDLRFRFGDMVDVAILMPGEEGQALQESTRERSGNGGGGGKSGRSGRKRGGRKAREAREKRDRERERNWRDRDADRRDRNWDRRGRGNSPHY